MSGSRSRQLCQQLCQQDERARGPGAMMGCHLPVALKQLSSVKTQEAVEVLEHDRQVVFGRGELGLMAVKLDHISSRSRQSWP